MASPARTILGGVNVSNDAAAFRASVERFRSQDMNRAIAIALNRTADGVRAEAIRRIRTSYKIQANALRAGFVMRRAYAGKLQAMVYASGRPLGLIGFGARQTKKGVTVDVKGSRKLIPGAFIATLKSTGYRGVFTRKVGANGKRFGRYPIKTLTTVSIPGLFRKEIVQENLAAVATDRFRRELASAVRFIQSTQS